MPALSSAAARGTAHVAPMAMLQHSFTNFVPNQHAGCASPDHVAALWCELTPASFPWSCVQDVFGYEEMFKVQAAACPPAMEVRAAQTAVLAVGLQ